MPTRSKWSLVGIPDHQGVLNVGGRAGAAGGPEAFRRCFRRLNGRAPVKEAMTEARFLTAIGADVEENLRKAADLVRESQKVSGLTVVVGGGHDHGYSHLLGISEAFGKKRVGCINIDAHLDVRKPAPKISSGSPFYLAMERKVLDPKRFVEFGIQSHCNAAALWDYVDAKKVTVVPFASLRSGRSGNAVKLFKRYLSKLARSCDVVVISLDIDAVASAFAPGVSAPQAEGFTPSEIIEMMEIAGKEKKVASLGIFELNPEHDIGDRTAILSATAAYHFVQAALGGSS